MNANQVVIVMDREEAEGLAAGPYPDYNEMLAAADGRIKVRAALDRDPDIEGRIARALHFNNPGWGEWDQMSDENQAIFRSDARAVLHALQEGTE